MLLFIFSRPYFIQQTIGYPPPSILTELLDQLALKLYIFMFIHMSISFIELKCILKIPQAGFKLGSDGIVKDTLAIYTARFGRTYNMESVNSYLFFRR